MPDGSTPGTHRPAPPRYEVTGLTGLPEVRPDDDVAALIAAAVDLQDGDVVVVTSKLLSKAEGRLLPVPHGAPAVLMVATPVTTLRDQARALVRAALRAFLATLAGCPA